MITHPQSTAPADDQQPVPWTVLSSGRDRPPTLTVPFHRVVLPVIVSAAAVILAVAAGGTVAARRLAEREAVNAAATRTDILAATVQPAITAGLLADPDSAAGRDAREELDRVVRSQVLGPSLVRVKLWAPDGTIVYSDDARLTGRTFELGEDEVDALEQGHTRAEVSDLSSPENVYEQAQRKLLEVYRPVWTPEGEALLFETYAPYDTVLERAGQLWRGFAGLMISSLLLLVVLLQPVLWHLLDRLRVAHGQREALLQRAVDASLTERRRIAANLHDGVVQELAAASFTLAGLTERTTGPAQDTLREVSLAVRTSITGLRSLLVDIYPPSLATAGLGAALTDLVAPLRSRGTDIDLQLPTAQELTPLDAEQQRLIFRVAHECLTNATKHAAPAPVSLTLRTIEHHLVLEVRDSGGGFDPARQLADPAHGHLGLSLLRDLAREHGADLRVASAAGRGTHWQLTVQVPR